MSAMTSHPQQQIPGPRAYTMAGPHLSVSETVICETGIDQAAAARSFEKASKRLDAMITQLEGGELPQYTEEQLKRVEGIKKFGTLSRSQIKREAARR